MSDLVRLKRDWLIIMVCLGMHFILTLFMRTHLPFVSFKEQVFPLALFCKVNFCVTGGCLIEHEMV